jgi:hypothetical protein
MVGTVPGFCHHGQEPGTCGGQAVSVVSRQMSEVRVSGVALVCTLRCPGISRVLRVYRHMCG